MSKQSVCQHRGRKDVELELTCDGVGWERSNSSDLRETSASAALCGGSHIFSFRSFYRTKCHNETMKRDLRCDCIALFRSQIGSFLRSAKVGKWIGFKWGLLGSEWSQGWEIRIRAVLIIWALLILQWSPPLFTAASGYTSQVIPLSLHSTGKEKPELWAEHASEFGAREKRKKMHLCRSQLEHSLSHYKSAFTLIRGGDIYTARTDGPAMGSNLKGTVIKLQSSQWTDKHSTTWTTHQSHMQPHDKLLRQQALPIYRSHLWQVWRRSQLDFTQTKK